MWCAVRVHLNLFYFFKSCFLSFFSSSKVWRWAGRTRRWQPRRPSAPRSCSTRGWCWPPAGWGSGSTWRSASRWPGPRLPCRTWAAAGGPGLGWRRHTRCCTGRGSPASWGWEGRPEWALAPLGGWGLGALAQPGPCPGAQRSQSLTC